MTNNTLQFENMTIFKLLTLRYTLIYLHIPNPSCKLIKKVSFLLRLIICTQRRQAILYRKITVLTCETTNSNYWSKVADHSSELLKTNLTCAKGRLLWHNHSLLLFNPAPHMSPNMKPWKKGAVYLMCCKKESNDQCQSMGGPCTVGPILTSSQPSDLSNYRLFLRADRDDYQYMEKQRWISVEPYALINKASSPHITSNLTHTF